MTVCFLLVPEINFRAFQHGLSQYISLYIAAGWSTARERTDKSVEDENESISHFKQSLAQSSRQNIYLHSSTNPENLAKIGPVDVEIIGLTGIVKNKKQQQNIQPAGPVAVQQQGGLKKTRQERRRRYVLYLELATCLVRHFPVLRFQSPRYIGTRAGFEAHGETDKSSHVNIPPPRLDYLLTANRTVKKRPRDRRRGI